MFVDVLWNRYFDSLNPKQGMNHWTLTSNGSYLAWDLESRNIDSKGHPQTWQKTRITKQRSIMKMPPRLIVWPRSTMERAIMQQARSTRRPPSSTLVRHTKPRRRLTKNLDNRSNLQLE